MMTPEVAGRTDVGAVRKTNQDAIGWRISADQRQALLVLADGMGGYQGGEIASRIAVETVEEVLAPRMSSVPGRTDDPDEVIQAAINLANERIQDLRVADPDLAKMGTTLVIAWVIDGDARIAHLGDSRCYLIHRGQLQCQTRDDTVVQNMLDDGSIQPDDVPHVPFRNVLTRALGASSAIASFRRLRLERDDGLLLCSDGLTNALSEDQWLPLVSAQVTPEDKVQALMDACLENEAADNVSVVLMTFN